jgi:hypothetical protein
MTRFIAYRQFIGFATGISCGGEVANLLIFVLTQDIFRRYAAHILNHDRYIDDSFVIWTSTAVVATAPFAELNALDTNSADFYYQLFDSYFSGFDHFQRTALKTEAHFKHKVLSKTYESLLIHAI